MPISSVPEKAKFTATIVIRIGTVPCANQPSARRWRIPGAGLPSANGSQPTTAAPPSTMNTTMVTTLISENQNSPSANQRADTMFKLKISTQNSRHHGHAGLCGNQYCMQNAAAVRLDPNATVQVSQYNHATT